MYIESLSVAPIKLAVSFTPAPWHARGSGSSDATQDSGPASRGMVRVVLSLADIEGAWITLKALNMQHPLLGPEDLLQKVVAHYSRWVLLVHRTLGLRAEDWCCSWPTLRVTSPNLTMDQPQGGEYAAPAAGPRGFAAESGCTLLQVGGASG